MRSLDGPQIIISEGRVYGNFGLGVVTNLSKSDKKGVKSHKYHDSVGDVQTKVVKKSWKRLARGLITEDGSMVFIQGKRKGEG